jgi:His-Xaa-Ser system protein HxsD
MESRLLFDEAIYSIEALKKAAYRGISYYSVVIKKEGAQYECLFSFPEKTTPEQIAKYLDGYKKEVLDQDLRETIKKETEGVRNLILAHAFSKTGLIGDE